MSLSYNLCGSFFYSLLFISVRDAKLVGIVGKATFQSCILMFSIYIIVIGPKIPACSCRTYGFILTMPDLSPNIGVLWYVHSQCNLKYFIPPMNSGTYIVLNTGTSLQKFSTFSEVSS